MAITILRDGFLNMKIDNSTPKKDGFFMPSEYSPHSGTVMIWPVRPGSWPYGGKAGQIAFCEVADAIAQSEPVFMLTSKENSDIAKKALSDKVTVLEIDSDDAWARDVCPTFVINSNGNVRGVDWAFNAWGGEYDGLYKNWKLDDLVASKFCTALNFDYYDAHPFVLEGGAIHSDGEGTVMVTEACLLSKGRNPDLSKEQIEEKLKEYLGAEKVVWLPCGIYNDETNEHIDNICAFTAPATVVLAWTDDENDPQYNMSKKCFEALQNQTDAKGRRFEIHKLPIPSKPICITKEDLNGFIFEEGEDTREVGERLAASYVNFYISNGGVIVPQFGDENDAKAVEILQGLFPNRTVYPIKARDILVGGGNIHCITQQIPKGD